MANAKFVNYSTLQELIDKFISRYGTEKTFNILHEKLQEKNPSFNQDYVIANIIANSAIELFKISTAQFKLSPKGFAYYARASSYWLIMKHTKLSYDDILTFFNESLTINKIRYSIKKIKNILDVPKINSDVYSLVKNHEKVVAEIIKTIP